MGAEAVIKAALGDFDYGSSVAVSSVPNHMGAVLKEPEFLLFASDATWLALWAAAAFIVAILAFWAERRRIRRKSIDSVGWVPWTTLFLVSALIGVTLATLAIKGWATG
ncbi:hypothetical protein [Altericroceibacterium endophyticum]|uniref:Uncharacterized protein n=1 Tax=Altericroceibacterium endophyticum TaxID=1808508 RepID=A0A6I4SZW8_9SPHN|nr:hypothetical protein [Altericroceibacterium endophyticum]MXO64247.1 hypothetical protein [Altericroceibacterium endophyticum]